MAAIIFDLDGTIADSFEYVVDFLAKTAHLPPLTKDQKHELHGVSMAGMARNFGIGWWRLPGLFYRGRRGMRRSMAHVHPFAGMPEVIEKLHGEGHQLFVVSSNSVRNVRTFLHHHQLHRYFLELYGSIGIFSKAPTLRKLVREHNFDIKDCVYIGDELRDVQAAQSINMRVIAVTWGFARVDHLQAAEPEALIGTPTELLAVLEEI
jgi:phosphoglycolate phosphatase-like HAD superfamily hydrolase